MTAPADFDRRRRISLLICFILVLAVSVAAFDKHQRPYEEQKNGKGSSKDIEGSELSSHHEDHEATGKSNRVHSGVQSSKTNTGNSAALNRFLENVLRAQDDFKWIDQAVHEANRVKYWQRSPSEVSRVSGSAVQSKNHHGGKSRQKRSYDSSMFRKGFDIDGSQNGVPGSIESSSKTVGSLYNTVPKDWTKTEDICSLSDWLNSKESVEEKRRDRWIRDYEVDPKNHLLARDVKDREASPSLEALKETLLQLKKSLNEADKKVHDTAKNVEVEEDVDEQKVRGKKKHDMLEDDEDNTVESESSGLPSNLRKREQIDLEDKSNRKAWRTKRTEGNNGGDNPKLFYRAGFGTPYLDEEAPKKLHDRKRRRSKATLSEKDNPMIRQTSDRCEKVEVLGNFLSNSKNGQNRRDLSRRDSNAMEERSRRIEEKSDEDLVGNSLRTFGPASNGLEAGRSSAGPSSEQAEAAKRTEETVSAEGEQAIKVFEPQGRLSEDSESTKAVLGSDEASEAGKLSQKRRTRPESRNINILLKSENKDLIQFSDGRGSKDETPFVLNTLDVRKKLVLGNEAGKPERTLSAVYNVKMKKSLVDEPADDKYRKHDAVPLVDAADVFGKPNGDPFKDTLATFMSDGKEATHAAAVKESLINGDKDGSRVFYDDSTGGRNGVNTDGAVSLAKENAGDEVKSREERPEKNTKGKLTENNDAPPAEAAASPTDVSSSAPSDDLKQYEGGKKTKYHEIVIVPDGVADLKLNDAFGRRILQYMEYSNDDVENAESNYDMEEDTRQAVEAENIVQPLRTLRSPAKDKGKAKVNVLISDKLGKKKKTKRESVRKRREPIEFIAYYDYDDDVEQQVRDATGDQEPVKTNSERNAIVSNLGLEAVPPPPVKDDQQAKEMEKQRRRKQKMKNKTPVQYYLPDEAKNETVTTPKPYEPSGLANVETFDIVQDGSSSRHQSGRSNVRREEKEMKRLDDAVLEPIKYIMGMDERVVPGSIDDYQCMDPKSDRKETVEPLYEELKQLYDWSEDEVKIRPRINGDQRLYHELKDKEDPTINVVVEPRGGDDTASDPSPNLLPLLLVQDGPTVSRETSSGSYPVGSSEQPESSPVTSNVSRSNYFALKSTDDMFKGGPEQANSTAEKLRGPDGIGADGEPRPQKVNGGRNDGAGEKDAAGWSLTGRRQYIDTDSRSPYETRKYPVPAAAQLRREQVQNLDRTKQTVISPRDLHESFVEPSDWVDDLDVDAAVRLGRGLKTIEDTDSWSNLTKKSISPYSAEIARTGDSSNVTKAVSSVVGYGADPVASLWRSGKKDNARVRRETTDLLGGASLHRDSIDDGAERIRHRQDREQDDLMRLSDSDADLEYNYPEKPVDYKRYAKAVSSPKAKKENKRKKKKKKARGLKKKKKKKGRERKKSANTRKRRHRKKHSENSKPRDRKKKHKKRGSKNLKHHAEVKKSKTDHGEAKVLGDSKQILQGKRHRKKMADVDNAHDQQRKMVSLLLAADNVQDESQMDAAVHGELAGKIVEQVYNQVRENQDLRTSLGPGLYRNYKTDVAIATNKRYRQVLDDTETKHTEELMKKVMQLLNRLVFDEVERKTCVSLPPDLAEFLAWMLEVNPGETTQSQLPTVPLVHSIETVAVHLPQQKFLFRGGPSEEKLKADLGEMQKKLALMRDLIKDYNALSEAEKTKVQSVRDYLEKQLNSMLEYVESKQKTPSSTLSSTESSMTESFTEVRGTSTDVPEYLTGVVNATNEETFDEPDRLVATVNIADAQVPAKKSDEDEDHRDRRRAVRSVDKRSKRRKKHRAERNRGRRDKAASAIDQPRYKSAGHKAAATRQKRDYLDKDFWAPFHQGFEAPVIYSSMDMVDAATSDRSHQKQSLEDRRSGKSESSMDVLLDDGSGKDGDDSVPSISNSTSMKCTSASTGQVTEVEAITGKSQVEDEILLLNKQQSWRKANEEQLEEVAFGEDMRKGLREKKLFEKLTEIDKEKSSSSSSASSLRDKRRDNGFSISSAGNDLRGWHAPEYHTGKDCDTYLSDEEKLRRLEEKINVYSDNDHDTRRRQEVKG